MIFHGAFAWQQHALQDLRSHYLDLLIMSLYIDPESVYSHFPKNKPIPQRLIEFLDWLNDAIDDKDGWFPEFMGEFLDWYLRPVDISPYFAVLASLGGEGAVLAYWFYEGCDDRNPPIVILANGCMVMVAGSIEELVARLVSGEFPDKEGMSLIAYFYIFNNHKWMEKIKNRAEREWGLTDEVIQQLASLNSDEDHPSLKTWIDCKRAES